MKQALSCGLIVARDLADLHLSTLEKLEAEGVLRLCCVAFMGDDENSQKWKARLEARGVHCYFDFQKFLEGEKDLDGVSIVTPIFSHQPMTAAALARGLFVYLEKPPVPLIQQLEALVGLDHRHKVVVGFEEMSSLQVRQLKQWRIEGALGEIHSIRTKVYWPQTQRDYESVPERGKMMYGDEPVFDGPATHFLSHLLHSMMFLAGKNWGDFDVPAEVEGEFYRAAPIESYDTVCLRGKLESGITFLYTGTHACPQRRGYRIELFGSKGNAWISNDGQELGNNCDLTMPPIPFPNPLLESYRNFVKFAQGRDSRPMTRLQDARGYLLATNGGLMSSNGIHSINSEFIKSVGSEAETSYEVADLGETMDRAFQEEKMFSELGVRWARKGHVVSVRSLRSIKLQDYMSH